MERWTCAGAREALTDESRLQGQVFEIYDLLHMYTSAEKSNSV